MKMDFINSKTRINGYKRKWYEKKLFIEIEWIIFFGLILILGWIVFKL